jgi:hypothetical protein
MKKMNSLQEQLLAFSLMMQIADSTPAIALCCEEHKQFTWSEIQRITVDIKDDKLFGVDVMEYQTWN